MPFTVRQIYKCQMSGGTVVEELRGGSRERSLWPMERRKQSQMQYGDRAGFNYISTCVMGLYEGVTLSLL